MEVSKQNVLLLKFPLLLFLNHIGQINRWNHLWNLGPGSFWLVSLLSKSGVNDGVSELRVFFLFHVKVLQDGMAAKTGWIGVYLVFFLTLFCLWLFFLFGFFLFGERSRGSDWARLLFSLEGWKREEVLREHMLYFDVFEMEFRLGSSLQNRHGRRNQVLNPRLAVLFWFTLLEGLWALDWILDEFFRDRVVWIGHCRPFVLLLSF